MHLKFGVPGPQQVSAGFASGGCVSSHELKILTHNSSNEQSSFYKMARTAPFPKNNVIEDAPAPGS